MCATQWEKMCNNTLRGRQKATWGEWNLCGLPPPEAHFQEGRWSLAGLSGGVLSNHQDKIVLRLSTK